MEAPVLPHSGAFVSYTLSMETPGSRTFTDITDDVRAAVRDSGIGTGLAVVASQHTTAAIVVNEHEPELLKDLDLFLHGLAPEDEAYAHNAVPCQPGEHPNGHAHCQALLLNASATVPIVGGHLILGRYQRIFLVELDRCRRRKVVVALMGS